MQKLAIALNNLGPSQIAFNAIRLANRLGDQSVATLLLYEQLDAPCMGLETACMNLIDGYSWDGTIIATSLAIAEKVLAYPGPRRKLFYMWDLEWLRLPTKSFTHLFNLYNNKRHEIIARSAAHADKFTQLWGRKPRYICEDFHVETIQSIISAK